MPILNIVPAIDSVFKVDIFPAPKATSLLLLKVKKEPQAKQFFNLDSEVPFAVITVPKMLLKSK